MLCNIIDLYLCNVRHNISNQVVCLLTCSQKVEALNPLVNLARSATQYSPDAGADAGADIVADRVDEK